MLAAAAAAADADGDDDFNPSNKSIQSDRLLIGIGLASTIRRSIAIMDVPVVGSVAERLIHIVNQIDAISPFDYRPTLKRHYCNLARRLKLLTPLFQEMQIKEDEDEDTFKALLSLSDALDAAKDLLRFGTQASKIYLVRSLFHIMKSSVSIAIYLIVSKSSLRLV